ncbi:RNA-directed DNA polymerase [Salmonella enterica subsp. enterica serovar Mgulani]|nr:RNA-directed DNA polymerase [Salmonella enterica subsp. enterica serovar Mgulani]ECE6323294.1 RNA-directed DNA polymerase [Salmonella enterica subsp. enterica]ECC0699988.1 RNA-directed DNA polymerase [Salmonella enterica subsp. enterica serovar Mgulani]ECH9867889.1 RNA-directed DNA polymerase [Salmonella enterica subsp. enterica]ECJ1889680.1 RNA-directed DNA polymerase [Salmonella enterica subsp. enterica serovar Mgulani]
MNKSKLDEIFNAYFNGKLDFSEMLTLNITNNINTISVGSRQVVKCSSNLKRIHSFLNLFIFDLLEIQTDCVFSYRKNVNVVDAIRPHSNNKFILKTDIKNFFPSITRMSIYECINRQIEALPFSDLCDYLDKICDLVTYNGHLPMGFSTSPQISNAVFNLIDIEIKSFCIKNNLTYTRYADDILISSNSYLDKEEYIDKLTKILSFDDHQCFTINTEKTKLIKKGKNTDIMGVKIQPDGTLTISKKLKNEVETKLYLFSKNQDDFVKFSKQDKNQSKAKLTGQLNYINTIDPDYIVKLKSKYGNSLVELFFRKAI